MQLLETITPKSRRFFIDSKRVGKEQFEFAAFRRELSCLLTVRKGETVRHYKSSSEK
jgi:hypothetical protein